MGVHRTYQCLSDNVGKRFKRLDVGIEDGLISYLSQIRITD
ncbi:hypothetical protein [Candidatus Hodgkinia cicadicola]